MKKTSIGNLDRREFLKLVAGSAATAAIPVTGCARVAASKPRALGMAPTNIIFLLTDDQRWDTLSCMGNPIIRTPNMDDLAANGVLFTHAFVTTSICASSRASILSGQYVRRHGINNFATSFSEAALARTYPLLLRSAGYRIGCVGKHGVGRGQDFPVDQYDVLTNTTSGLAARDNARPTNARTKTETTSTSPRSLPIR